ncbi:TetR/AcrR family transcriptional regulator [Nocardioides humi]|uniref:TetR/AcrR family transcriptional regulator n=1 Tax=Nocardioides humi TaxID=449461 RepID=UPI001C642BBE|nr:TetR/AcrR family transcriptional regulator [Nocardioides humi]
MDGRALRYRHRRAEILAAVLDYLLENGVHGLSFRKLGTAVGVSHVTMRHHFGTKDELLLEVMELIRTREPVPLDLPPTTRPRTSSASCGPGGRSRRTSATTG